MILSTWLACRAATYSAYGEKAGTKTALGAVCVERWTRFETTVTSLCMANAI